jgi:hypothetical protein
LFIGVIENALELDEDGILEPNNTLTISVIVLLAFNVLFGFTGGRSYD